MSQTPPTGAYDRTERTGSPALVLLFAVLFVAAAASSSFLPADQAGKLTIGLLALLAIIGVVALFSFMAAWNDFLGPLIYLLDQKNFTLSLGLQFYQSQNGGTSWNLLMAASAMVIAPVIVLFFFTQRLFIQGIAITGLKG